MILFSSIFSLTNYAQASLPSDSDNCQIEDWPGVVELNKDQVRQLFKPLGTLIYTEKQAEKLHKEVSLPIKTLRQKGNLEIKFKKKKVIV